MPSRRLRHASDISVAGDDPVNEVDPSGLCSSLWNPFCPIVTAVNWVGGEASNNAATAVDTSDCVSDIAQCTNTPQGHANYVTGIENTLYQLGGYGVSLPEPYPSASPGSYQAGELFPYIVIAVVAAGVDAAAGAGATGEAAEGAAASDTIPTEVTGYTQHGLEQALERDGGLGVSETAIQDAVSNPLDVVRQDNGTFKFVGNDATVVLNSDGKVVTTWANNSAGWRNQP